MSLRILIRATAARSIVPGVGVQRLVDIQSVLEGIERAQIQETRAEADNRRTTDAVPSAVLATARGNRGAARCR
jgi:hypothetical protein